jgi:hypothetical protein
MRKIERVSAVNTPACTAMNVLASSRCLNNHEYLIRSLWPPNATPTLICNIISSVHRSSRSNVVTRQPLAHFRPEEIVRTGAECLDARFIGGVFGQRCEVHATINTAQRTSPRSRRLHGVLQPGCIETRATDSRRRIRRFGQSEGRQTPAADGATGRGR